MAAADLIASIELKHGFCPERPANKMCVMSRLCEMAMELIVRWMDSQYLEVSPPPFCFEYENPPICKKIYGVRSCPWVVRDMYTTRYSQGLKVICNMKSVNGNCGDVD
jgi:hypothetical protein